MLRALSIVSLAAFIFLWVGGASAQVEASRFRILPANSQIIAEIEDPFGNTIAGRFQLREGEAKGDPNRLKETASVKLVVDAGSYDSGLGMRDQDVLENYLEAGRYPRIIFQSTGITSLQRLNESVEQWRLLLKGELDLHGVTQPVEIALELRRDSKTIHARGSTTLALTDYKIQVPQLFFWKAAEKVTIQFQIVGEAQP